MTLHRRNAAPARNPLERLVAHRTSRRAFMTALAAGGAAGALAGCSTSGASGGGGGGDGLAFFSWDDEAAMRPLLDLWAEQNPDVPVQFSQSPPVAEYIAALQTRVLSGTAADVFMIAAENKTNLIDGEAVTDLSGKPYMEGINEFNAATYARDGRPYGMSVSSWGAGIAYNRELLAGVGADGVPETWDEFLALCAELKAAGTTPYIEAVTGPSLVVAGFLGAQNAALGGTMDQQIFDGSSTFVEQWTEPLAQWLRLWDEGYATRDAVGITGDQGRDEFAQGRVAMTITGPWDVPTLRESAPDLDFALARVPALAGGSPFLAGAASPGFAVNSRSEKGELADRFLAFMASREAIQTYNEENAAITTTADYEPVVDPALEVVAEGVRAGEIYLPQIAWTRAEDKLNETGVAQAQLLVQGSQTPEGMAAEMDRTLASA
ncbi:ABC transporter substrate-binding protein [Kineococcus sp. SYSU DK004]|uniref:ABC transporter substrate-binding protein n=1 Tax=Kineococcus sp. SYSU DK004 TaxID=3383125 RepID=UPI003D7E393B